MKNEIFYLWEGCCAAFPTNVILFVDDHPTSSSASSIGQVVCESTIVIQPLSCLLDKNEVLHLWEGCCALPAKGSDQEQLRKSGDILFPI